MHIRTCAKCLLFHCLAIIALLALSPCAAWAQFGIGVGLNFDSIGDVDTGDSRATFDNSTGYHVGVFYDLSLGPAAIRPGVFLRRVQDVDLSAALPGGTPASEVFSLTMIEVPVDLRYRLTLPAVTPYLLIGPVFGFSSTDSDELEDAFQDLTMSASIGAGVELSLPGFTPTLYPEIRYSFGISRVMKDEWTVGGSTITAEDAQRLNAFMLRLGITF